MDADKQRKIDQLRLASSFFKPDKSNDFDQMHLIAPALPETRVQPEILATEIFGYRIAAPFFIEAMTGGSDLSFQVNKDLSLAASKTHIPMALGSASMLERDEKQLKSFTVAREYDPDGLIFANINPETSPECAGRIVDELGADALQIHLNAPQELVMPEGMRDFHWIDKIVDIKEAVDVPVIVKAVGFGFDKDSLQLLMNNGIEWVDLGGAGGTNFVQIENARGHGDYGYLGDLGLSTVISLMTARQLNADDRSRKLGVFASGGVRQPLDIMKSLVLGARMVGIASTFLHTVQKGGSEALIAQITEWKQQLGGLCALFGYNNLVEVSSQGHFYFDLPLQAKLDQILKY
ncbi:MAG: type 2 isopentenyl-diphosphate Delta-isomerase [Lactobacillus sp.]|jgi:isopentenyl-diphosphate delta-isomerase|nr:type 2 isopentenyl-diphosphate Delta-isomerase [Lactobacillus sp.]MCH4069135.1 type 2 isopentenyl-diphosphate Delta-isomerase [Lactobacillus sp.]MCI1303878.1 type 2 isopentenyl-diphosphate Delta-isomerase [Lactobacillus sp.]MCI1329613.1 type 2 isopentenyl-diphosphate Delta-isomerase [Lactobacillus sp.]MCI1359888.1 type 2 isopentenyl-diphosphate Delta-isomerase [Lactobacillus sp.]